MFILSNYFKGKPLSITEKNNRHTLSSFNKEIRYFGIEKKSPVKYFCIKRNKEEILDEIQKENLIPAKIITMETVFEKEIDLTVEDTYEDLLFDFGDKNARERFKKREFNIKYDIAKIHFNVENQLLPPYNRNADTPNNIYSLELMFGEDIFENFKYAAIEYENMSSLVKDQKYSTEKIVLFRCIDCIYRILSMPDNFVDKSLPKAYRFYHKEIKKECFNGRLTTILKDKLIVKLYILLLICNDYEINYESLPKFNMQKEKINTILVMIGCKISKSGAIRLSNMPKENILK